MPVLEIDDWIYISTHPPPAVPASNQDLHALESGRSPDRNSLAVTSYGPQLTPMVVRSVVYIYI
jgi:hypothetical protein